MQLVSGRDFYKKPTKMFDEIVGFAKFSEYLIVAEVRLFPNCLGPVGTNESGVHAVSARAAFA
jgi:hypothetical protein